MNRNCDYFFRPRNLAAVLICVLLMLVTGSSTFAETTARLSIIDAPPFGLCGPVMGTTSGVAAEDYYVAILIYIPGAGWWSKP